MEPEFLTNLLSVKLLIWLHFGTKLLIKYGLWLIVLPLLINIIFILKKNFAFGFGKIKQLINGSAAANAPIKIDTEEIKDYYKFAYAYSRNPNVFKNVNNSIFENLDTKIAQLGSSDSSALDSNSMVNSNLEDTKSTQQVHNSSKSEKLLNRSLAIMNIAVVTIIIVINIVGYFHTSSTLDRYFDLTKRGYELNFDNLRAFKPDTEEEVEYIRRIDYYLEYVNEVKFPKPPKNVEQNQNHNTNE